MCQDNLALELKRSPIEIISVDGMCLVETRVLSSGEFQGRYMNTEARLMELDALIKSKLSLIKADPEKCLGYLTELGDLDVQPLMLKKHPHIVDTIKKLRRYIGNVEEWGYTGDKKSLFIQQAEQIRTKAEYVFNKFKKLFVIPENKTFYQVFSEEVNKLKEHTVNMEDVEFYKLREEPRKVKMLTRIIYVSCIMTCCGIPSPQPFDTSWFYSVVRFKIQSLASKPYSIVDQLAARKKHFKTSTFSIQPPTSETATGEFIRLDKEIEDDIKYVSYKSELQMPDIMRLIQKDLSEPYSIYTYRYFIHNWPKLCFLAMDGNECVGAIVCKLDHHRKVVKRGYIAMLAVVLETEITNRPALRLYENLGFVRDKRLFRYYLNGVDALRLNIDKEFGENK
uniref:N-acetyltransferase domain-containing protein n=1 Tax=Timema cristinae TaxID=61476 RepID=A0A7R9CAK7_TIMCR|nr:unnamed protein product [Timema cristinae]